jgi:hypothetical protein
MTMPDSKDESDADGSMTDNTGPQNASQQEARGHEAADSEIFVTEAPDIAPEPEPRPPGATLRSATRISARVVVGILAIAVAGATIAAAALVPVPHVTASVPSSIVKPVPAAQQLVCPGGLLRLSNAEGTSATTPSAIGRASVTSASTTSEPTSTPFSSSDAGTGGTASAPVLLGASAASAGSKTIGLVAGAEAQAVSTSEFAGLASAGCVAGSGDVWLAGGSNAVGRTTLLTLADASAVPATVSLEIYGENGIVSAPGMSGIIVPASGQRVISLAGFAPDVASPVVHVTSRGGQVVANLQQSTVRGLEPGGIDFVGEQLTPTRTTVIPGVVIANSKAVQSRLGEPGFDDLSTIMRVFVPGSKGTTARVSVIPENGKADGNAFAVPVDAGKVTDLPIDDAAQGGTPLADGSYTFVVTTSVPVVASVRVSTVGSAAVSSVADFAWMAPSQRLDDAALIAIPERVSKGMTSALHLQNPTHVAEHVILRSSKGPTIKVTVPAGSAASVPVVSGASYRASGVTALYASVTSQNDGGLTGFSVAPPEQSSSALRIYP